jgi:hypothetical protein
VLVYVVNLRIIVLMKLIYMADGLFLYEKENSYAVMDQNNNVLKELKTSASCARYILKTLQSRRAAERYAIEEINKSKV